MKATTGQEQNAQIFPAPFPSVAWNNQTELEIVYRRDMYTLAHTIINTSFTKTSKFKDLQGGPLVLAGVCFSWQTVARH